MYYATIQTTTPTEARKQFFALLEKVTDLRNLVVINRKGKENVVLIAESDLSSLLETAYLLKSPENARHLLAAIERSQARDTQPVEPKSTEQAISELKQELGIDQEKVTV
ncbi:MAG: type II toxin-antitoxin system Phd/YefM family antitoxin [Pseudanabaena sp. CRU_2_10]|nr:type II toxin-antitoxin system Phd/YefM family antitoxin [Pseudanabaena sp. CRU_2_10]